MTGSADRISGSYCLKIILWPAEKRFPDHLVHRERPRGTEPLWYETPPTRETPEYQSHRLYTTEYSRFGQWDALMTVVASRDGLCDAQVAQPTWNAQPGSRCLAT